MANEWDLVQSYRPNIQGTRHVAAAGHYLAAHAGFAVLEAGGNAIDAGVAAGLAINVLEGTMVSFAGVAPIIIHLADSNEVITISGLGWWPKKASIEYFRQHHGGKIPATLHRSVVPAAPDAWITALERFGTMSFGDVASAAIRLARDGFAMYPFMSHVIETTADFYRANPSSAAVFMPEDRVPQPGEIFRQPDLARSLQYLADEERAASGDRRAGLRAARDAFYKGDIAQTIAAYHEANGGLLTRADFAGFSVALEPAVRYDFRDVEVYSCGPWCQGPMLLQALSLLEGFDLAQLGLNSPEYIHLVAEAIKLAAADREAYYGDPRFVDVPMETLLSPAYAAERARLIRADRAWEEMPPAGEAGGPPWVSPPPRAAGPESELPEQLSAFDTSYLCVADAQGNAFSCTPSDGSRTSPVIPGLGFVASARGAQSWLDERHPSSLAAGKRPRLTPNPALAIKPGAFVQPFGTPGGDVQTQAMLQVFLNMHVFGMDPQAAVEAPRFATYNFPSSFEPHEYLPGRLCVESRVEKATGEALAARGHDVQWWPERCWKAASVCTILADRKSGVLTGAADPRRTAYACGW